MQSLTVIIITLADRASSFVSNFFQNTLTSGLGRLRSEVNGEPTCMCILEDV